MKQHIGVDAIGYHKNWKISTTSFNMKLSYRTAMQLSLVFSALFKLHSNNWNVMFRSITWSSSTVKSRPIKSCPIGTVLVLHQKSLQFWRIANEWLPPGLWEQGSDIHQYSQSVVQFFSFCWQPLSYPKEAGLPIGGKNYSLYVVLEIHYNNAEQRSDWIDSSGIRIYYTDKLRAHDAGVLEVGLEYSDKNSIPPKQSSFDLSGFCTSECTRAALPAYGITIFASQLHTHLTGVRVWTQHIRGGVELPEVNRDNHYSPHFQEIRKLKRRVNVFPGDVLINTCRYKTTNRTNITLGGHAISDEMCVNYLHYFQKTNLEVCKSSVDNQYMSEYFHYMNQRESQMTSNNRSVAQNFKSIDWNPNRAEFLNRFYKSVPLSMQCNQSSGERFPVIILIELFINSPLDRLIGLHFTYRAIGMEYLSLKSIFQ